MSDTDKMSSKKSSKNEADNGTFDADGYDTMTQIEHVLEKPGMYIGPIKKEERSDWLYDLEDNTLDVAIIDESSAMTQLFIEAIANAVDAVVNTKLENIDSKCNIVINMDGEWIDIINYSNVIPVVTHSKMKDEYIASVVFGTFYSSSNYNKNKMRHGAGINGIGIKVTNIYSSDFIVEINDPINEKIFKQKWTNNMKETKGPKIKESTSSKGYVKISYKLDFSRFDMESYTDNQLDLFARISMDNSATARVPIKFNDIKFNVKDIVQFANLYYPDSINNPLVHYIWPDGVKTKTVRGGAEYGINGELPLLEMLAFDNPYADEDDNEDDDNENKNKDKNNINPILAYCNSIHNRLGGVHYETALKAISTRFTDKLKEQNKKKKINITYKSIEKHVTVILFIRVGDPEFSSQTKTRLESWDYNTLPLKDFDIPKAKFDKVTKSWETMSILNGELEMKSLMKMAKTTDGRKKKNITLKKGVDANNAGGKLSSECVFIITEGDSALSFALAYGNKKYGRDNFGAMPIRGKMPNATNTKIDKMVCNEEIKQIKIALGLQEGVDYSLDKNIDKLRYGRILIATDSDVDGKHIFMLLYNYFNEFYPALVEEQDFIYLLRTPIVKARKGKEVRQFFLMSEYTKWKESEESKGDWKTKYYKGLGSASAQDIKECKEISREVLMFSEEKSWKAIRNVMDKTYSDKRKRWMIESKGFEELDTEQEEVLIDDFINKEFIEFCYANVVRAIPLYVDGFKESQRKTMWQILKKWGITFQKSDKNSKLLPLTNIINPNPQKMEAQHKKEYKVSQLANSVDENTGYKHGSDSLHGVIYSFSHDYPGSNNIQLLLPDSQCGTRNEGGKDAAKPRYSYVVPNWKLLPVIFRKEDSIITPLQYEEDNEIEPKFLLTTIPLAIINGVNGIGTGWSTTIPNHDAIDVVNCLRSLLRGGEATPVPPSYNYFKGDLEIIKSNSKPTCMKEAQKVVRVNEKTGMKEIVYEQQQTESYGDVPDDDVNYTLITSGVWDYDNDTVHISELPIGTWTNPYYHKLEKMVEKKEIKEFRDCSTQLHIDIELYGCNVKHLVKDLGLCNRINLNNMIMLDIDHNIIRYRNARKVIEAFYHFRLPYYKKRRDTLLSKINENIKRLSDRAKFIIAVNEKKLEIRKRKKEDIYADMDEMELPRDLMSKVSAIHFTKEEVASLKEEIQKHEELKDYYESKTAKELWLIDLDDFEDAYVDFIKERKAELHKDYKDMIKKKKTGGNTAAKKKKQKK